MKSHDILAVFSACIFMTGCAASSKTFYADASKVKDTQLCRTYFEANQSGNQQFAYDLAAEAQRRGLTAEACKSKVDTENGVLLATALVVTAVGVGVACSDGCGGGGYSPSYAQARPVDYDCAGGKGDGPRYVQGPFYLNGPDIYDLDADHDGIACELGEGGWGT
jgi:hypothetical protein